MVGEPSIRRSFSETVKHYKDLRRVAYDFAENEYKGYSIKIREITYSDAVEADKWSNHWNDSQKVPIWEWTRMYNDYNSSSGVKRFDVALVMHGQLCALCYGIPNRSKLILKIKAISRKPNDNPLEGKVLTIMLFAADAYAYARVIGAEELWLCDPMNDNLIAVYEGAGYIASRNNLGITTHLSMRLK